MTEANGYEQYPDGPARQASEDGVSLMSRLTDVVL